jgi:hypothetical protein
MGNALDMLHFVVFVAVPVVAGALLTWLVVGVALWVYRAGLDVLMQTQERRLEIQRRTLTNDLVLVTPDSAQLPRQMLNDPALVAQQYALMSQRVDALRLPANVPHSVTYSPHISGGKGNDQMYAQVEEQPALPAPVVEAKDIWQLWHAGALPDKGFFLGYNLDSGEPVTADWLQLYSALVGGTSGSGKSTLIRSVLVQSALQGGRFVVLDRHYGAGEESLGASLQPLRSLMLCDVAATEQAMVSTLRYVLDAGRRRLHGDPERTPLIMVVDETTALFQRSNVADELATVLGEIAQETRKVGVYALCIGQNFSGSIMKTEVRNSFASFFSCRTRRDVARVMSGNNAFAQAAEGLKLGQAVWMDTGGEVVRLAVPNCTQKHIELVARQCSHESNDAPLLPLPPEENAPSNGWDFDDAGRGDGSGPGRGDGRGESLDAQALQVRQMIMDGKSDTEIIKALWGVSSGSAYQKAASELQAIMRRLVA